LSDKFEAARSTRTFRLFVTDNASELLLPPLLKRLQKEAPGVRLRVQPLSGSTIDPLELARSIDAAIACVPSVFQGFYQQRLYTDRDACAVRRGHPIAHRFLTPEEFLSARHVAVVGREFREDPVDTWLREEGRVRNVALSVPHYLQSLHVVAQSDLIAVIPERLILAYAEVLSLDVMPVPFDVGMFDEYLLHPARNHSDSGSVWLRGVLKDIAKSLRPLEPHRRRVRDPHLRRRRARSARAST
jgi:DNA-binding transcriptional LysR family regulator